MEEDGNAEGDDDCDGDGGETSLEEECENSCEGRPACLGLSHFGGEWADWGGSSGRVAEAMRVDP